MLSNVWNIFSETKAYFGFLEFVYSNHGDKKVNDDDKNNRLSSVSRFDLSAAFAKFIINGSVLHRD